MSRICILLIFLALPLNIFSQVSSTPTLPTDADSVVITFDATQGTAGLKDYTGDVYAHTGLITDQSTSASDWKYVIAAWSTNLTKAKMTRVSANIYQLKISPSIRSFYGVPAGETIRQMAFVFRNSDGSLQGKATGSSDIFYQVYQAGLNASFISPSTSVKVVSANQNISIQASASNNDSICLFLDNAKIKSVTGQTLTDTITAGSDANRHAVIATAYKGTNSVADTFYYLVPGTTAYLPLPTGIHKGINYVNDTTVTLALWAPYKNHVFVIGSFNNWLPDNKYLMNRSSDTFWITLSNLKKGQEYLFQYLIDDSIRIADPYCDKISDPYNDKYISSTTYPNLIQYPTGKTTEIASSFQTAQTPYNWQVASFTPPAKDTLAVYELLIRDFTANSNIKTVTDTLNYLKKLGINAIELMPFSEFDGNDSWGYNPTFYFAPDKAYGTKADYKAFIDQCHAKGIAVIQDMVLDFSTGNSPLVRMYMNGSKVSSINPWYNVSSNMQNTSLQFGYDFNHDSPYTRALVDSITSYWMTEYKVDGFRFDFTKGFSNTPYAADSWGSDYDAARIYNLERMTSQVWKCKPNAIVIMEHLADNSEETVLANYGILLWGNMNYAYNQATMGYNSGSDFSWISFKNRGWNENNVMGYMESHDEQRLMYKNLQYGASTSTYNVKDKSIALRRMEMANLFFLSVPGPKMIWQFGELGYDISIDSSGRTGRKPILWNYYSETNRKKLYDVCSTLLKLKKQEPVFSTTDFAISATNDVKYIELHGTDKTAEIIGNFGVLSNTYTHTFTSSGYWYEYFTGDSINVTNNQYTFNLAPGEYKLYTNKKITSTTWIRLPITEVQNDAANVTLYPNPVTTTLYFNTDQKIKQVQVVTMQGSTVLQQIPTANTIDVSNLKTGSYILQLTQSNGTTVSQSFIKR